MRYRRLGSSDLEISEISLGSWLTFGGGISNAQAEACVAKAFELGINFIDTANVYSSGGAEEFLGEVLAERPRDSYVLATKLYFPLNGDRGLSREQVFKQIDASLARLRTDYVDLYQCHRYDRETPLEETMEALTEVVRQGKARYIGFSEWTADQIRAALALVPRVEKFVSSQPQYSLLYRVPEREVIPLCKENGISQIVWSPLAQGTLTGKYKPGEEPAAGPVRRPTRWAGRWTASVTTTSCGQCSGWPRSRQGSGSRWPSSHSRGCYGRRTSRRRSSEPRGPSKSRRTQAPPASSSTMRRCRRSTKPSQTSSYADPGNSPPAQDVPKSMSLFSTGLAELVLIVDDVPRAYYFYDPDGNLLEFWSPDES